eukprot:364034-Chlamydomonas_euryale.AAC.13
MSAVPGPPARGQTEGLGSPKPRRSHTRSTYSPTSATNETHRGTIHGAARSSSTCSRWLNLAVTIPAGEDEGPGPSIAAASGVRCGARALAAAVRASRGCSRRRNRGGGVRAGKEAGKGAPTPVSRDPGTAPPRRGRRSLGRHLPRLRSTPPHHSRRVKRVLSYPRAHARRKLAAPTCKCRGSVSDRDRMNAPAPGMRCGTAARAAAAGPRAFLRPALGARHASHASHASVAQPACGPPCSCSSGCGDGGGRGASRRADPCDRTAAAVAVATPAEAVGGLGPRQVPSLLTGVVLLAGAACAPAHGMEVVVEPGNALSLPTWAIHVSSVLEWATAMVRRACGDDGRTRARAAGTACRDGCCGCA